ncbi:MAG: hypothetical protein LUB59_03160 [Candidatus Gastranaerophilales bacterium]|nr:hypothetical protein [Candidatus Gastranaerophilales bacterium]
MQQPFVVGQAFWGKIRFPDGEFPDYERPYLVVAVNEEHIEILTVSSVAGKEWKLTIPTNMEIINYDPPFPKRTFVKLDSLQKVKISDLSNVRIGRGGRTLDSTELSKIINAIKR